MTAEALTLTNSPYERLSPFAKIVAQIYGSVSPNILDSNETVEILGKLNLRNSAFRKQPFLANMNREIVDSGIGVRFNGGQFARQTSVTPDWVLPLTIAAHNEGRLGTITHGYVDIIQNQYRYDLTPIHRMMFRAFIVAGRYEAMDHALAQEGVPGAVWEFLAEPAAINLWQDLPERFVNQALTACLNHAIEAFAPPQQVIDLVEQRSGEPESHAADVAFIRVLRGEFDDALATFAALPDPAAQTKAALTGEASTRAMIAMLNGSNSEAIQCINKVIAHEIEGTRKKIAYSKHRAFAIALIALIRLNTSNTIDFAYRLQDAAKRQKLRSAEVTLIERSLKVSADEYFRWDYVPKPGWQFLLNAYTYAWIGEKAGGYSDSLNPYVMEATSDAARDNGYRWIHQECTLLMELYENDPYTEDKAADRELQQPMQQSLVRLTVPMPSWERSLISLEQLAQEVNESDRTTKRSPTQSSKSQRRIAWIADISDHDVKLRAIEQRLKKNGSWTKGRRIASQRLAKDIDSFDEARDEDFAAARAMEVSHWSGIEYTPGVKSLFALAGHPYVFNENEQSIDVVQHEPEMSVQQREDESTVISLYPKEWIVNDEYAVAQLSARKVAVAHLTPEIRSLYNIVGEGSLVLPPETQSRALEAISRLTSRVRTQSSTDLKTDSRQVETDAHPWILLQPYDDGLSIATVVEPIPQSEIYYEPGKGGERVIATLEGQSVEGIRNLQSELRAADEVASACSYLRARPSENDPLVITSQSECLDVLEQLHAASIRCKWPKGEKFKLVGTPLSSSLSISVTPVDRWLSFTGELAIDEDNVINLARLLRLLDSSPKSRFLQIADGEFIALTSRFRRQLDDLASLAATEKNGSLRVHPLASPVLEELLDEAVTDSNESWTLRRDEIAAALSAEPEVPSTLQAELRQYQVEGFRWLSRLSRMGAGACLADDMGLGKTVQALAAILERTAKGPTLVVAPTSVVTNWVDEARRFAPTLNVNLCTGSQATRKAMIEGASPYDLHITSYSLLVNDIEILADVPWQTAVFDEAHAFKNAATMRAKAARRINASFLIATTGTPIQNNLMDLHSIFDVLNPGLLGSQTKFRTSYAEPIAQNENEDVRTRLKKVISPFILRRLKAEVLDDLPERTEIVKHVPLSAQEVELYEALRQTAIEELEAQRHGEDDTTNHFQIFKHLTKLRLACCNPRLVLDENITPIQSSKLATFAELLDELLENRHKVLVFSQFVRHLQLIQEHLDAREISYQYLDGSTPSRKRAERVAAFQEGIGDVFLISLKAGGSGLNLTAADFVIHLDPWWNPAVEDQASDRSHRIGQTRPVTIYRLITEGTIEEQVMSLHHRKRELADRLLEGSDASAHISTDELLDLISRPPVG